MGVNEKLQFLQNMVGLLTIDRSVNAAKDRENELLHCLQALFF